MTKSATSESSVRPFVHLRVHSAYSLLEGALPVKKIVAHAVKDAAPAIAISDTNNLFLSSNYFSWIGSSADDCARDWCLQANLRTNLRWAFELGNSPRTKTE